MASSERGEVLTGLSLSLSRGMNFPITGRFTNLKETQFLYEKNFSWSPLSLVSVIQKLIRRHELLRRDRQYDYRNLVFLGCQAEKNEHKTHENKRVS